MKVQFIEHNGQKQFAVIPVQIYEKLLEKAEMMDDLRAFDEALASNEESIPGDVVDRILNGENKMKVWREFRGLTQKELAGRCGLRQATIAQLEGGNRNGSLATLKAVAGALDLDLDDLV